MHGSIDNVATGHGAQALSALHLYLEQDCTDDNREAMFRRVWDGFLAFMISYDAFMPELEKRWQGRAPQSIKQRKPESLVPGKIIIYFLFV